MYAAVYTVKIAIAWICKKLRLRKNFKRIRLQFRLCILHYHYHKWKQYFTFHNSPRKRRRHKNDSSCRRMHKSSSPRVYTHANKVFTKGTIPYLLLASTLLDNMSPPPTEVQSQVPAHSCPIDSYVDLTYWDATTPTTTNPLLDDFVVSSTEAKDTPILSFDSDSFKIGVDTHATACMSPVLTDFDPMSL